MTLNPDYPTTSEGGTAETAKQEAGRLGAEAQGAARDVAGTARDEARHVKDEAVGQARSLAESAKQEATSQLSTQKDRLAVQSRGISEDLERISRGERPESDLVNQAVSMLSDRARRVTHHLESREPLDLLDDVRRFAARRPGTFLAIAAGIGLVAGRMTRGLKDAHDDDDDRRAHRFTAQAPPLPPQPPTVTGTEMPDVLGTPGVPGTTGAPGTTSVPGTTPLDPDPFGTGQPGGRP
ncbi:MULTISPECIES: hypothetical protein [Citricoccus]|uniref:hypothetical protein n=1 Tax=Citricoccus TaxID=169133 RepID=UPI000255EDE3|nr:hypothetical protein [Citricoccus sp. CH26A]